MNSIIKVINAYLKNKEIEFDKNAGIDYYVFLNSLLNQGCIETKENEEEEEEGEINET